MINDTNLLLNFHIKDCGWLLYLFIGIASRLFQGKLAFRSLNDSVFPWKVLTVWLPNPELHVTIVQEVGKGVNTWRGVMIKLYHRVYPARSTDRGLATTSTTIYVLDILYVFANNQWRGWSETNWSEIDNWSHDHISSLLYININISFLLYINSISTLSFIIIQLSYLYQYQ